MSNNIALFSLLKSTLALLLEREDVGQNCDQLIRSLNSCVAKLREGRGISDELLNILTQLTANFVRLRACVEILQNTTATGSPVCRNESEFTLVDVKQEIPKETESNNKASSSEDEHSVPNKTKQPSSDNPEHLLSHNPRARHVKLQIEVQAVRNTEKFIEALENFREMNVASAKVFENEKNISTKITATKLHVISGTLGNLTDLSAAEEKCLEYMSKLNGAVLPNKEEVMKIKSVMLINVFVFRFMKEILGKTVAMLNWPLVYVRELYTMKSYEYHPILGKPPVTMERPYPFTNINLIQTNEAKRKINSSISAVNCRGEVFAKTNTSSGDNTSGIIVRLLTHQTYNVDDGYNILSISIDCSDCKKPTKPNSQLGETSSESSAVTSCSQPGTTCKGKMCILAQCNRTENFRCFLFVIDMEGNIVTREELGFLERGSTVELVLVKIFCVREKKLLILDVTRRIVHVCDSEGIEKNTIDVSAYLSNTRLFPIFTYEAEMICLESKLNFLNTYYIFFHEEGVSVVTKRKEIKLKPVVKAIAFDHELDRVIVLCYSTSSFLYHLMAYSMTGKLAQDIELADDNYRQARVIFHPNGPVVLLDNNKLLRLK